MNHSKWFLHNNKLNKSINDLSLEQAIEIVKKEPATEREFWFAWTEQLGQWTPITSVKEFTEISQPKGKMPPPPPPPPAPATPAAQPIPSIELDSEDGLAIVEFVPSQNQSSAPPPENRRKHHRYDLRLRVIVRSEDLTFRSFSTNISLGGFAVENILPPGLIGKECHIYFADQKSNHNIRFHAKLIPNRKDARYFIFTGVSQEDTEKLSAWFKRYGLTVQHAS